MYPPGGIERVLKFEFVKKSVILTKLRRSGNQDDRAVYYRPLKKSVQNINHLLSFKIIKDS